MKVCLFKFCPKRQNLCWVPSHIGIRGNEKADTKSVLDLPRVTTLILNTILTNIFSPLGKMIGVECGRKQASFCQTGSGRFAVLPQAVQEGCL